MPAAYHQGERSTSLVSSFLSLFSYSFLLYMNFTTRLSMAFSFTKDMVHLCLQDLLTRSDISPHVKREIVQDLEDIDNILGNRNFTDIDAIEEALVALNE